MGTLRRLPPLSSTIVMAQCRTRLSSGRFKSLRSAGASPSLYGPAGAVGHAASPVRSAQSREH
eukprot:scaffold154_cov373-Prasinococcus_capsulatus_cf.AAC.11